jgi:C-terminal processing protease CtpA/Prc
MRTVLLRSCVCLIALLLPLMAQSQSLPNRIERLVHTCKVWGYVKYFHPGAAGSSNNMDSALLMSIAVVDTATSYDSFEKGLLLLFEPAGRVKEATEPELVVDTLSKLNLDLRWHQDQALPVSVRSKLDSIRINFRPFDNHYFKALGQTSYVIQEKDYTAALATSANYPLLLLFRAWNIHNYFSPYRRLLTPSWDSSLVELIPHFEAVTTVLDLHLAFARYQAKQQDAHSASNSTALTSHFGSMYLPCVLSLVEGKTVVTKIFTEAEGLLRVGDVVLAIDGTPVNTIRDSLRPYVRGGATEIVGRNTSTFLLRGSVLNCTLEVENTDGIRTVELQRSSDASRASDSISHPRGDGEVWKLLPGNIGYVNVGALLAVQVPEMYQDLRATNAIVFDMRNYPGEFLIYDVANRLLPSRRAFCNFYFPDPLYPGTFETTVLYCGPTTSNPNYYKGEVRILQNEITQSQAEFTIMAWQTHPNAKIFGSHTAGADGNVSTFNYPTGLSLADSACGVLYPDRSETQIVGIGEDVTVTPTINGIREGRDEVLEAALASLSVSSNDEARPEFTATRDKDGRLSLILPTHLDRGQITLYDVLGRRVFTQLYTGAPIDVTIRPAGIYLLELNSNAMVLRTTINM